jgi:hypothetical protein
MCVNGCRGGNLTSALERPATGGMAARIPIDWWAGRPMSEVLERVSGYDGDGFVRGGDGCSISIALRGKT